jgi:hypothetical protein
MIFHDFQKIFLFFLTFEENKCHPLYLTSSQQKISSFNKIDYLKNQKFIIIQVQRKAF